MVANLEGQSEHSRDFSSVDSASCSRICCSKQGSSLVLKGQRSQKRRVLTWVRCFFLGICFKGFIIIFFFFRFKGGRMDWSFVFSVFTQVFLEFLVLKVILDTEGNCLCSILMAGTSQVPSSSLVSQRGLDLSSSSE